MDEDREERIVEREGEDGREYLITLPREDEELREVRGATRVDWDRLGIRDTEEREERVVDRLG